MVTVTELANTMFSSGIANSLDWHWTEARFPKSVLFTKIRSLMLYLSPNCLKYELTSTKWAAKQLLKPLRSHTWINMALSLTGLTEEVWRQHSDHVSRTSQSASQFAQRTDVYLYCGDAIGLFWSSLSFFWVIPSFVELLSVSLHGLGLQTRRGIS